MYTKNGNPVKYYGDLPELELNAADKEVLERYRKEQSTNPKFHDGDHILIRDINFDLTKNIMYLEAVKVTYALMNCIQRKLFGTNSPMATTVLWRHGVISPFITKDNFTCIFERSLDKFYSAAAGFIQPTEGNTSQITFSLDQADLIAQQGIQESNEEFLWDSNKNSRLDIESIENRGLSIRRMGEGMPVLEFVSPIRLKCSASELETVLATNAAPDGKEHTDNRIMLNLDSNQVTAAYSTNLKGKSGIFLYEPIVQTAIVTSNPDKALELISAMNPYGRVFSMQHLVSTSSSSSSSEIAAGR
jgi:hypothetical protein